MPRAQGKLLEGKYEGAEHTVLGQSPMAGASCCICDLSQQNRALVAYKENCDISFIWKSMLSAQSWYLSYVNWMQHCSFMVKKNNLISFFSFFFFVCFFQHKWTDILKYIQPTSALSWCDGSHFVSNPLKSPQYCSFSSVFPFFSPFCLAWKEVSGWDLVLTFLSGVWCPASLCKHYLKNHKAYIDETWGLGRG